MAERLVKETDGGEIKKIELERKHAEIVPGEAGSGVERGSAASAAQVCHWRQDGSPLVCIWLCAGSQAVPCIHGQT